MPALNLSSRIVLPVVALAAVAGLAGLAGPSPALRMIASLPLLLLLPGWAVLDAVDRVDRSLLERASLAAGLSLALAAACGFVLNGLDALTPSGWAAVLAGITLTGSVFGWWRGPVPNARLVRVPPFDLRQATLSGSVFAMAGILVVLAVAHARQGALAQREYDYTEFWMLPSGSRGSALVTLGIRNLEAVETTYRIEIVVDGDIVGRWAPFTLSPNETVSQEVPVNLPPGPERRVEAWLFRSGAPDRIYRKVWMPAAADPDRRP